VANKWYLTCAAVVCLAAAAWADPAPATPAAAGTSLTAETAMTLEQAEAMALQANKPYQAQLAKQEQAQAKWWQAMLAMGPSAGLQASYLLGNKPSVSSMEFSMPPLPPQDVSIEMLPNYYSGAVVVTQPLFTGFKLLNNLHLAGLQYEIQKDGSLLSRTQLRVDVTRAFYNVLVNERLVAVTEASLAAMQKHLDIVKARYREGSASNYDVLRSQVQVANMQPGLVKLKTALSLAKSTLASLTGLDLSRPLQLSGSLKAGEEQWPGLGELQQRGLERRLELKNLDRSRRMAEIGHTLAATSNLPNLALNGTWTYSDMQDSGFPPQGANIQNAWQVSLNLSWPIWDNLAAIPKAAEAAAKVREAELGRQALEDGVRLDVEAAYLSMMAAKETLDSQNQTTELARESYRLAENQYRNGMATNIDVMDAQIAQNQAEINYLQAQYDYVLAGIKLHQAAGDTF
jgi:outer membrane protein